MKLELKNGVVDILFDYAFVVYTGPDAMRHEPLIAGRPRMQKDVPTMIEKKFVAKLVRTGLYAEWKNELANPEEEPVEVDVSQELVEMVGEPTETKPSKPFFSGKRGRRPKLL